MSVILELEPKTELRRTPGQPQGQSLASKRQVTEAATEILSAGAATCMVLFLVLPLAGLFGRVVSTGGFLDALRRPIAAEALRLSLVTTAVVLALAVVFGSPLAIRLARKRFRGAMAIDTLVDLPMVLPPAVAGIALLLTFGRRGLFGSYLSAIGVELPFTSAAVVMASLFVAAPFFIRAARAGFMGVPREVEEAAMVEGASSWQVFRHVTAPLAMPALAAGAVMCWARALGEFGATIMFAGSFQGHTQTMPLAIYAALEQDLDAAISLCWVLLAVSLALLLVLRTWAKQEITT